LNKKLIIRHEYGQLGNILFRLSNTLAFAIENGYRVEDYTLSFCNYHDGSSNIRFFENYHSFHFFEYPRPMSRLINRIKWKFRKKNYRNGKTVENFDPSFDLTSLPPHSTYELKGFHFSAKDLVTKHREKICKILDFRSSIKKPIDHLFQENRSKYNKVLGVHIRKNDFIDFYEGKYFVPVEHYLKLIDQFKKLKFEDSLGVLICSDSPEVFKKVQEQHPDCIFPKGKVAQDMYALSQCDYILSPQATTFSAWSAFTGEVPIFQIDQNANLRSMSDFKQVSRMEPFNLN
jgi:hypothetical protein